MTATYTPTDQARWFVACATGQAQPSDDDIAARVNSALLQAVPPAAWRSRFSLIAQSATIAGPPTIDTDGFRLALATPPPVSHRAEMDCRLDDTGRIAAVNDVTADTTGLDLTVRATQQLPSADRDSIHALFDRCYRNANHDYLETQLDTLRNAATLRRSAGGELVGFALGDTRQVDLPGLPDQTVSLAGLACVQPDYRRRGLFVTLENTALAHNAESHGSSPLLAGRVAHPASLRPFTAMPSAIPRPDETPTQYQQDVGTAIAALYRVEDFDPSAFVCKGNGTPIGEPVIDIDATEDEWQRFAIVDRSRGDSLLALVWNPGPPDAWRASSDD